MIKHLSETNGIPHKVDTFSNNTKYLADLKKGRQKMTKKLGFQAQSWRRNYEWNIYETIIFVKVYVWANIASAYLNRNKLYLI